MSTIIEIQDVTKRYGASVTAVDRLSLRVEEGEFVTLLGPSGCGKTTTLRMIAGFELPNSGRILLAGEDVTELPPYHRQVNTVFQDYALFPHMTIRDNVGYGLRVAGVPKSDIGHKVKDALQRVGLQEKAEARPAMLSGGQKQRVALARALVREPKVLLLDEPLSALDAKLRQAMQVELKHLHQQLGITFVFVTHDQNEALVMSDRVVVMHQGAIVQSGTPADLYDRPATPYVADFIGHSNTLKGRVVALDGQAVTVDVQGAKIQGTARSDGLAVGASVLLTVRPEKAQILQAGEDAGARSLLTGRVLETLFHGSSCRTEIDIGEAAPFEVDLQLRTELSRAGIAEAGTEVRLALDPETVSVFSDTGTA